MNHSPLSLQLPSLLKVALPMSLGAFIQFFVVFTDNLFVAQINGNAMSAVSYIGLCYITIGMITTGIASSIQIIIARRVGEDRQELINGIIRNGLMLGLLIAFLQWSILHFVLPVFLENNIENIEIRNYMISFLDYRQWGFWFYTPTAILLAYWSGIARTRVILYTLLITSLSNVILDYWFIFGGLGIRAMGSSGAGLATTLAEFFGFIFLIYYSLSKASHHIHSFLKPYWSDTMLILKLGLPIVFQMLIALGVWMAFYTLIESRGAASLQSAFIVRNMYMLAWVSVMGFSSATRTFTSQLMAEKRWKAIKKLAFKVSLMNLAGILILSHGLWLYPNWITSHFTQDSETIRLTLETMKIILPAMIIYSFTSIMLAVVEGTGSTMAGFWIEVITSIIYAISVYMMVKFTNWEVPILWLADYLYFIILGICSITFLKYGKWKHKMI